MSLRLNPLVLISTAIFAPGLHADLVGHWRFDEDSGTTTAVDEFGEWHHVALTASPTRMKTYIDGKLINTKNHNDGDIPGSDSLEIGRLGRAVPTDPHQGVIDDVQIYGRTPSKT